MVIIEKKFLKPSIFKVFIRKKELKILETIINLFQKQSIPNTNTDIDNQ